MDGAREDSTTARRPAGATFWSMLEPAERALLRQAGTVLRFEPGQVLFRQGDSLRHVLVLLAGRVEVAADAHDGYEAVLAVRGPGDLVGEFAAVDGRPRSATLWALDRVQAIAVPAERFSMLCQSHPRLTWTVLRVLVGRLRELSKRRVEQGGSNVAQRLVALLVELAAQHGVPDEQGLTIAVPLTQQKMAGMISASRESVVRVLRDLRGQGLITTRRRHITVLRPDALRRLAS